MKTPSCYEFGEVINRTKAKNSKQRISKNKQSSLRNNHIKHLLLNVTNHIKHLLLTRLTKMLNKMFQIRSRDL